MRWFLVFPGSYFVHEKTNIRTPHVFTDDNFQDLDTLANVPHVFIHL